MSNERLLSGSRHAINIEHRHSLQVSSHSKLTSAGGKSNVLIKMYVLQGYLPKTALNRGSLETEALDMLGTNL